MYKIIYWYGGLSKTAKTIIKSIGACLVFYGGAVMSDRAITQLRLDETHNLFIEVIVVTFLVAGFSMFTSYVDGVLSEGEKKELAKKRQLLYATSQINNVTSIQIRELRRALVTDGVSPVSSLFCCECMQEIVDRVYQYFESFHGQPERLDERVDFEVTFMTLSYIDGEITIPAYANREGRAPFSLKDRAKSPDLYKNTVTAALFKELRPTIKIVSDTADPKQRYSEVYAGQKERIKSSIIFPVLDNNNELLGTLVVHCNKSNFFRTEDERFWKELLEIYASRLAFEKSRIDLTRKLSGSKIPEWKPVF